MFYALNNENEHELFFNDFRDITENLLVELGHTHGVEHLGNAAFPTPALPVNGFIVNQEARLMVPLVVKLKNKPNAPAINVWFAVTECSPSTILTPKTLNALGAGENDKFVAIQDESTAVKVLVSEGLFQEANILGTDAMNQLDAECSVNEANQTFVLMYKQ